MSSTPIKSVIFSNALDNLCATEMCTLFLCSIVWPGRNAERQHSDIVAKVKRERDTEKSSETTMLRGMDTAQPYAWRWWRARFPFSHTTRYDLEIHVRGSVEKCCLPPVDQYMRFHIRNREIKLVDNVYDCELYQDLCLFQG